MTKIALQRVMPVTLTTRKGDDLPDGVIGRVEAVAMVYDTIDSYRTIFRAGSMDKTRNKVAAGKVKFFDNHGMSDNYGTRSHIGIVRSLTRTANTETMAADLFDTEDGRRAYEYLRAVRGAGGETGVSIGFYERSGSWEKRDGSDVYVYDDIELDEISLAPRQAVPGALVTNVRTDLSLDAARALFDTVRRSTPAETFAAWCVESLGGDEPSAPTQDERHADEATATDPEYATMSDRTAAIRALLSL
jgi:HK97 family phage prohead protease